MPNFYRRMYPSANFVGIFVFFCSGTQRLVDRITKRTFVLSRLISPSLLYHYGLSPFESPLEKDIDIMFKKCLAKIGEPREKVVLVDQALPKAPATSTAAPIGHVTAASSGKPLPSNRVLVEADQLHPKRARVNPPSGPGLSYGPSISTSNQSFFTQSVMENEDGNIALQFLQSVCPTPDREFLEKLGDADLIDKWSLSLSKAMAMTSVVVARMRNGFKDPQLVIDLKASQDKVALLSSELERTRAALKESQETASSLKAQLEAQKSKHASEVEKAHAEGVKIGRESYLHSEEGLSLVQRVRDATRKTFVRSEDFYDILVGVVPFYADYVVDMVKEWVASGNSVETFDKNGVLDDAPDHPDLSASDEDTRMNSVGAADFLDYVLHHFEPEVPATSPGGPASQIPAAHPESTSIIGSEVGPRG